MREIDCSVITRNIKEMCISAAHMIAPDMKEAFARAAREEQSPLGRKIIGQLQEMRGLPEKI